MNNKYKYKHDLACELQLKETLDELIKDKRFNIAEKVLNNVKETFSLYDQYKALINKGKDNEN